MNIKDDGYMPLHLAALNDHLDVVTALAEMVIVKINANPVSQYCNNVVCQAFTMQFILLWFSFLTWLYFNLDRSKLCYLGFL